MRQHSRGRPAACSSSGFTLIELIITLTLSVIVVAFAAMFISGPVQGFNDQARRARLVDTADVALARISRDVRSALPNSVRAANTGGVASIELLGTTDGARYRREEPGTADQILDFAAADAAFNVIGPFTRVSKPFSSTSHHLAIYNVGVPGADAYELANVMTPTGTEILISVDGSSGEDRVSLTPAFRFAYGSPTQRVFLVEGPISYVCDSTLGTLTRYTGYTLAVDHADRDTGGELLAAGATAGLVADSIVDCGFSYAPGTSERAGMVSLEISVGDAGETVSLLAQVHVDNVP
jgi:MSHA biogenesis protein MshO